MAQPRDNSDALIPVDAVLDAGDQPVLSFPYSQDEIEDLLYGADRPVEERMQRLRDMREELVARESGDFGDQDPKAIMVEIDRALEELQADSDYADENGALDAAIAIDPNDHLDALSPDDVEARQALTGEEDEDSDENFDAELEDDEINETLGLQ
ncbi:hypothetical protein DEVEQU_01089 [Devosia equisanguinis]|uniref:Uncharacterized protein n=1 Tax=Devosia equisanguinis TaxID=2490941 RepID=A0A3S4GIQ2_9HYPH|nr:hypothetical protein [Devosia equisanguinis]VDS03960.1 hypothetical protein DEVEQU_01089 [Devosia equisanguinis]